MNRILFALTCCALLSLFGCDNSGSTPGATLDVSPADTGYEADIGQPGSDIVKNDARPDTATESDTTTETDTATEPDTTAPCHTDSDCDDGDLCTVHHCQWGQCYNEPYKCGEGMGCYESAEGKRACAWVCQNDDQCATHNPNQCLTTFCQYGFCQFSYDDGKACNDNDACTVDDACNGGECHGKAKECEHGCLNGLCQPACQNNADCEDGDVCTTDTCVFGTCQRVVVLECCSEQSNTCQDDNNPCTALTCVNNQCEFVSDDSANCEVGGLSGKCANGYCWNDTVEGNCYDANPCTDDATENNACVHSTVCADGNPCTQDSCIANGDQHTCTFEPIQNCCLSTADCDDNNVCTKDTCHGMACQHENKCLGGEPQMFQCQTDADCVGTGFGDYCLDSGDPAQPALKLCQSCYTGGPNGDEMFGCEDGDVCLWGYGNMGATLYAVYYCQQLVCQTDADCDDGIPCTQDICGYTGLDCSHIGRQNCFECQTDADCVEDSWCNEEVGGVYIKYAVCQPDHTCQVDYWANTVDLASYGCKTPYDCEQDEDCPGSGECLISNCYFPAGWPSCVTDADCGGTGTCDFHLGECSESEFECYTQDDPITGLSKDCDVGYACIDNACAVVETLTCQTDADCTGEAFGGVQYYCGHDVVTDDAHCYACRTSQVNQIDDGCGNNVPYCSWNEASSSFGCVECVGDQQCSFGSQCVDGFCWLTDNIMCQFQCPQHDPAYQTVYVWYDDGGQKTAPCGGTVTLSPSDLCQWGLGFPAFSFNLTDGQWVWNDGVNATLTCNQPATVIPDPKPSPDNPEVTLGSLGVALVQFQTLTCQ